MPGIGIADNFFRQGSGSYRHFCCHYMLCYIIYYYLINIFIRKEIFHELHTCFFMHFHVPGQLSRIMKPGGRQKYKAGIIIQLVMLSNFPGMLYDSPGMIKVMVQKIKTIVSPEQFFYMTGYFRN